jgi:peptidoglycan/xylan/chitin deacetylase (PgdA/CDA1 family)
MLRVERSAGVHATYHVVGALLPEVRDSIEQDGHSMAFHSFDHRAWRWRLARRALARLRRRARSGGDQLACCRDVDYRIRGYRPPQSHITRDLGEAHLCLHNFEWLASSAASLHLSMPTMQRRVVKIPILFDDYAMYHDGLPYETWERQALAALERAPFVAFSLHDCYGSYWLPHYPRFLEAVRERGTLRTLDEVADEVILRNAWAGPPTVERR